MAIKIPTYTSTGTITTQTAGRISGARLDPRQTPAGSFASTKQFLVNDYIQEKQTEANNESYQRMNDFYIDEKDNKGNITQKGLMTIISEAKEKPNPTEADQYFDSETKKLFKYKSNKFGKLNNFQKKAIEKRYYATAGLIKTKVLEQSRLNLIETNYKIDDDTFVTETMLLKQLGPVYIDTYKNNLKRRIDLNPDYDDGTRSRLLKKEYEKGILSLASSMSVNQPNAFKAAVKSGKFNDVNPEQLLKLDLKADETIKDQKFDILTESLNLPLDADYKDLLLADSEIQKGTFGGNQDLQKIYSSLTIKEQKDFKDFARKKARNKKTDMQFQILAANQQVKQKTAQESKKIFDDIYKKKGVTEKKLKELFGGNKVIVEQFMQLNEKIINNTANKISNFEKNDDIIKLIINGDIDKIDDKFNLAGETGEGKSILERVGESLNVTDVKYLNNLLSISNENDFKENHNKFFAFMDNFKVLVAGSLTLQELDDDKDNRLSNFKYVMYNRYIQGLQNGKTPAQLLDITNNNPDFIGKDISKFIPKSEDLFKSLRNKIKKSTTLKSAIPKPQWSELSKKYGKELTLEEYKNTKEYQSWLKTTGGK